MKVVILCGGQGTRLREETEFGCRGNMIKDYFLNFEAMNRDCTVRLGPQPEITHHGEHVTYCDGLSDVNISDLVAFHKGHGRLATVTAVRPVSRFGCTFEREPLEQISTDGQLSAFCHDGFFFAMDTYREFKHLNDPWGAADAPWKVW